MSAGSDQNTGPPPVSKPESKEITATSYEVAPILESGSDKLLDVPRPREEKTFDEESYVSSNNDIPIRKPLALRQEIARVRFIWWWVVGGVVLGIPATLGGTVLKDSSIGAIHVFELFAWLEVVWAGLWASYFTAWVLGRICYHISLIDSLDIFIWSDFLDDLRLPITLMFWTITIWATVPITCDLDFQSCSNSWDPLLRKIALATLVVAVIFLVKNIFMELLLTKVGGEFLKPRTSMLQKSLKALVILIVPNPGAKVSRMQSMREAICSLFGSPEDGVWNWVCALFKHPVKSYDLQRWEDYEKGEGEPDYYQDMLGVIWASFGRKEGDAALPLTLKQIDERFMMHKLAKKKVFKNKFRTVGDLMKLLDADNNQSLSLEEVRFLVTEVGEVVMLLGIGLVYAAFFAKDLTNYLTPLWTTFTGLSFALSGTVQEFLSACILLFVKHPYDGGDRIIFKDRQLIVEKFFLMHTRFRSIKDDTLIQIPHSELTTTNIENLSRTFSEYEELNDSVELIVNPEPPLSQPDITAFNAAIANDFNDENNPKAARYFKTEVKLVWVPDNDKTKRSLQIEFKNEKRLIRVDEVLLAGYRRDVIKKFYEHYNTRDFEIRAETKPEPEIKAAPVNAVQPTPAAV